MGPNVTYFADGDVVTDAPVIGLVNVEGAMASCGLVHGTGFSGRGIRRRS
jgi:hypothetical protein